MKTIGYFVCLLISAEIPFESYLLLAYDYYEFAEARHPPPVPPINPPRPRIGGEPPRGDSLRYPPPARHCR